MEKWLNDEKPEKQRRQRGRQPEPPLCSCSVLLGSIRWRWQLASKAFVRCIGLQNKRLQLNTCFLAQLGKIEILPNLGKPWWA